MKKLFTVLLSVLLCSFANCNVKTKPLVVITSADNPPYEYVENDAIVGFDIDLAKIIGSRLHRNVQISSVPFSSIIPTLRANQCDFAISSITPTEARKRNLDFSVPYQDNVSALVVLNDGEFENVEEGSYFPLGLLCDKTIGVQLGTIHEHDLKCAEIQGVTVRRYNTTSDLIAEMSKSKTKSKILYGIIISVPEASALVKKNRDLTFYKLKFSDSFAIAFPSKSVLRDDVNKVINDLLVEGKIVELEAKWKIEK